MLRLAFMNKFALYIIAPVLVGLSAIALHAESDEEVFRKLFPREYYLNAKADWCSLGEVESDRTTIPLSDCDFQGPGLVYTRDAHFMTPIECAKDKCRLPVRFEYVSPQQYFILPIKTQGLELKRTVMRCSGGVMDHSEDDSSKLKLTQRDQTRFILDPLGWMALEPEHTISCPLHAQPIGDSVEYTLRIDLDAKIGVRTFTCSAFGRARYTFRNYLGTDEHGKFAEDVTAANATEDTDLRVFRYQANEGARTQIQTAIGNLSGTDCLKPFLRDTPLRQL